jgi:hypothetical protein
MGTVSGTCPREAQVVRTERATLCGSAIEPRTSRRGHSLFRRRRGLCGAASLPAGQGVRILVGRIRTRSRTV